MAVKKLLHDKPRDLCLFTLGINTAFRANELLSLKVGDVSCLQIGDFIELKQMKNKKYRSATLNHVSYEALQRWLYLHPDPKSHAPLFISRQGGALTVNTLWKHLKKWCKDVGLEGNYGTHTLRKTWGYHQRTSNPENASVSLLMRAYGHTSEAQTLAYLGIQPQEIGSLYLDLEL